MHDANGLLAELRASGRQLKAAIPEVYSAHIRTSAAAMSDGALSGTVKELIALAISVTRECDGCIAAHAEGLARKGASEQEVAEALGVAITMNGGPGTVWAPRAFDAFRQFAAPPD